MQNVTQGRKTTRLFVVLNEWKTEDLRFSHGYKEVSLALVFIFEEKKSLYFPVFKMWSMKKTCIFQNVKKTK